MALSLELYSYILELYSYILTLHSYITLSSLCPEVFSLAFFMIILLHTMTRNSKLKVIVTSGICEIITLFMHSLYSAKFPKEFVVVYSENRFITVLENGNLAWNVMRTWKRGHFTHIQEFELYLIYFKA